jgi:predicted nucleic acid-binding protein
MTDSIVDTAVLLKWVIVESDSPQAESYYSESQLLNRSLMVLDLAMIEADNGIWKKFHRKLYSRNWAMIAHRDLAQIPLIVIESLPHVDRALEIACDYDIAVYDAHFVAAVENLGCDGITADEPLVKAVGHDFPSIKLLKDWATQAPPTP